MAYKRKTWQDHVTERPRTFRFTENEDGTKTLIPAYGATIQKGTPLNAKNFNSMEEALLHYSAAVDILLNENKALSMALADVNRQIGEAIAKAKKEISGDVDTKIADTKKGLEEDISDAKSEVSKSLESAKETLQESININGSAVNQLQQNLNDSVSSLQGSINGVSDTVEQVQQELNDAKTELQQNINGVSGTVEQVQQELNDAKCELQESINAVDGACVKKSGDTMTGALYVRGLYMTKDEDYFATEPQNVPTDKLVFVEV